MNDESKATVRVCMPFAFAGIISGTLCWFLSELFELPFLFFGAGIVFGIFIISILWWKSYESIRRLVGFFLFSAVGYILAVQWLLFYLDFLNFMGPIGYWFAGTFISGGIGGLFLAIPLLARRRVSVKVWLVFVLTGATLGLLASNPTYAFVEDLPNRLTLYPIWQLGLGVVIGWFYDRIQSLSPS